MIYISMSPKVICEGAKRPSWGGGAGRGCPPPSAEKFLHLEPEKTVSDAYFGQRLLEYDFLQMARGKTIISSVKHAVSDTLIIIIISKRCHSVFGCYATNLDTDAFTCNNFKSLNNKSLLNKGLWPKYRNQQFLSMHGSFFTFAFFVSKLYIYICIYIYILQKRWEKLQ